MRDSLHTFFHIYNLLFVRSNCFDFLFFDILKYSVFVKSIWSDFECLVIYFHYFVALQKTLLNVEKYKIEKKTNYNTIH